MFLISFFKICSILLAIIGANLILPLSVAFIYNENSVYFAFLIPMIFSFVFAFIVTILTRKHKFNMKIRQIFLTVALIWIITSLFGSIPFFLCGFFGSFTDSFFESVSGFSTTGASILNNVEILPRSINLWRCQTHWLGGMGIVTLTVALLPLLGIGGFQLIKAETTGPEKGKVTARITTTAKILWGIYITFTIILAILLKIFGMNFVDAISHAFSTLGTGGLSSRNNSIGSFNSSAIEITITIFMILAGINFSLYYYLILGKFSEIKTNTEFKLYLTILITLILATTFSILPVYEHFGKSLKIASFQISSLISTTGFSTADFVQWPSISQLFLFITFFLGGCSGSTAGGFKIIRWAILGKQFQCETKSMIHPRGVFSIRLNGNVMRKEIVLNVISFAVIYAILVAITTFVGCIGNLDLWTSFTTSLSMVGNIGPGFGILGPSANFSFLPNFVKWWYCFAMLAGRLELYTMIIFFTSAYWKK